MNRVYAQYRTHQPTVDWYNITNQLSQELRTAYGDISNSWDIDNNVGEQLNVIGRVLVQPRVVLSPVAQNEIEFGDSVNAEFALNTGAEFTPLFVDEPFELNDDEYKLVLKAKALKNVSNLTIDSIVEIINTVLENASVSNLIDNENMTFSLEIAGTLSVAEQMLLNSTDFVPPPQGVRYLGFTTV